ncbi:hypothetical protein ACH4F6_36070 [Streptomyces sp. NPDC017936]|uniref:hypothetical protein n=1 Tax=Streptomyces sp. NPDC017936 TaxID=3365016 RepID=UPI0037A497D6
MVDEYEQARKRWQRTWEAGRWMEQPQEEAERTTMELAVRHVAAEYITHPDYQAR